MLQKGETFIKNPVQISKEEVNFELGYFFMKMAQSVTGFGDISFLFVIGLKAMFF